MKQLDAEWKEVSPIYDKWQAGRHKFKSNDDLQAFRRRYEDCRKARRPAALRGGVGLRGRARGSAMCGERRAGSCLPRAPMMVAYCSRSGSLRRHAAEGAPCP